MRYGIGKSKHILLVLFRQVVNTVFHGKIQDACTERIAGTGCFRSASNIFAPKFR